MNWKLAFDKAPSSKQFLEDIVAQVPEENGAREAFEMLLDTLAAYQSKDVTDKLAKLEALENNGVDNWEYYDDAMAELDDEGEEDDE